MLNEPTIPQFFLNTFTLRNRSHFGTSPEPWNYLLKGMTLLPDSIMGNRDLMQALAEFSEPLVRITDKLVRKGRVDALLRCLLLVG